MLELSPHFCAMDPLQLDMGILCHVIISLLPVLIVFPFCKFLNSLFPAVGLCKWMCQNNGFFFIMFHVWAVWLHDQMACLMSFFRKCRLCFCWSFEQLWIIQCLFFIWHNQQPFFNICLFLPVCWIICVSFFATGVFAFWLKLFIFDTLLILKLLSTIPVCLRWTHFCNFSVFMWWFHRMGPCFHHTTQCLLPHLSLSPVGILHPFLGFGPGSLLQSISGFVFSVCMRFIFFASWSGRMGSSECHLCCLNAGSFEWFHQWWAFPSNCIWWSNAWLQHSLKSVLLVGC